MAEMPRSADYSEAEDGRTTRGKGMRSSGSAASKSLACLSHSSKESGESMAEVFIVSECLVDVNIDYKRVNFTGSMRNIGGRERFIDGSVEKSRPSKKSPRRKTASINAQSRQRSCALRLWCGLPRGCGLNRRRRLVHLRR